MAQLVVAEQAQGILSNPTTQILLVGGGLGLAYWWYQNNVNDPDLCLPGLGAGMGGNIVKEACKIPNALKTAGEDGLTYIKDLPDRISVAASGDPLKTAQLAQELKESNNIFDQAVFSATDLITAGQASELAQASKTLESVIDATQPDPELTRSLLSKHRYWFDKFKDNQWINQEALRRTNFQTNFDMGVDQIAEQVERETGGMLRLIEGNSPFVQQGGRVFYLTGQSKTGDWVKVGTPWGVHTGWYGLIKMYFESQNKGKYFESLDRQQQKAYILSIYGPQTNKQFTIVLWGSGESVPAFFQYYGIEYDMEKQYLKDQ